MQKHTRADRGEPAEQRRVLAQDRLVALRAGRDQAEGHADQLLEPLEVAARLRRQIDLVLGAARRREPAFDLLVDGLGLGDDRFVLGKVREDPALVAVGGADLDRRALVEDVELDRKSTRLNSSHGYISYAVFCLKKKKRDEVSSS